MKCTNFLRGLTHYRLTAIVAIICLPALVVAAPTNNPFDPQPMHTICGLDKYFKEKDLGEIRFSLSPFYTHASTARDANGGKVPGGDRLGKWNMFALQYGQAASPANKLYNPPAPNVAYPNLTAAFVAQHDVTAKTTDQDKSRYRLGVPLTTEANFDQDDYLFALMSVPCGYERLGVRGQLAFDFGFGLGVSFKGGAAEIRNRAKAFAIEDQFAADVFKLDGTAASKVPTFATNATTIVSGVVTPPKVSADNAAVVVPDAAALYKAIFEQKARAGIAKELGIDLSDYRETVMEDVHMQLHWHLPFDIYDKRGDISTIVIPMFAVGAWLPISSGRDQNKALSVAATNDGFLGVTADFSLGFDFPVMPNKNGESLQLNLGGGLTYFTEKTIKNYRFASSKHQVGMIPWTIDSIKKKPGITWYLNASMCAEEFTEGLSLYADYMYTAHEQDSFTIAKAAQDPYRTFATGGQAAEEERSAWKTQQAQVGISYAINPDLKFGAAVQAPIQGVRIMRTVTVMGTVTIVF